MRIILANSFIGGRTGSETWLETMSDNLKKHQVILFDENSSVPYDIDLAIINHNTCLKRLKDLKCKKIFTSHGIIPSLEQPIKGADIYVSVSEEVQEHLKNLGFDSIIIRNGIDCEKFKKIKEPNIILKNVLYSSNYQGKALKVIQKACQELNLNLTVIGKDNRVSNVVDYINNSDLVIGLGRTAYEAMACERNVIIYDYNGGDGYVTKQNMIELRKNNCSGRRYKKDYTVEELKNELLKYNKDTGRELREYILEHNNIQKTLSQYLTI